jgi:hypothetical protein
MWISCGQGVYQSGRTTLGPPLIPAASASATARWVFGLSGNAQRIRPGGVPSTSVLGGARS